MPRETRYRDDDDRDYSLTCYDPQSRVDRQSIRDTEPRQSSYNSRQLPPSRPPPKSLPDIPDPKSHLHTDTARPTTHRASSRSRSRSRQPARRRQSPPPSYEDATDRYAPSRSASSESSSSEEYWIEERPKPRTGRLAKAKEYVEDHQATIVQSAAALLIGAAVLYTCRDDNNILGRAARRAGGAASKVTQTVTAPFRGKSRSRPQDSTALTRRRSPSWSSSSRDSR